MSGEQAIEGAGLRVVFRRLADRYVHRVESIGPGGVLALAESLEGSPEELWPASPPLQELHIEQRGNDRQLAFLVGRAGANHWSLSIELDAAEGKITFDAACRVHSAPERLGSSYRLLAPEVGPAFSGASSIGWAGGCGLKGEPIEGEAACQIMRCPNELQLTVASVAPPWPLTVRWRYAIGVAPR